MISFSSTFQHPEHIIGNLLLLSAEVLELDQKVSIQGISINIMKVELENAEREPQTSFTQLELPKLKQLLVSPPGPDTRADAVPSAMASWSPDYESP